MTPRVQQKKRRPRGGWKIPLPKEPIELDLSADSWTRQPKEPAAAYGAFICFRDMAPAVRTVTAAYRRNKRTEIGTASGTWYVWSKLFRWEERSMAWDQHVSRARRDEELRAEADRRDRARQARMGFYSEALALARGKVRRYFDQAGNLVDDRVDGLAPSDAARFGKIGATGLVEELEERRLRVEVGGAGGGPVEVSTPSLAAILEVLRRLAGEPEARKANGVGHGDDDE